MERVNIQDILTPFEYQLWLYSNSIADANEEDEKNFDQDNRYADVTPVPWMLHEQLTELQIEALESLKKRYDRALRTHNIHGKHCDHYCRFHPRYGQRIRKIHSDAEFNSKTRRMAKLRREAARRMSP